MQLLHKLTGFRTSSDGEFVYLLISYGVVLNYDLEGLTTRNPQGCLAITKEDWGMHG